MARRSLRRPTVADVRSIAATLPRSYEADVHGRVKFRVGQLVFASLSHDETILGFAFPKELRDALVDSDPDKFLLPIASDLRFNWMRVRLAALDQEELYALVVGAWRMCVPKKVYLARMVALPTDAAQALAKAKLRRKFDALAFTHQKEHVRAITEAKQPETRAKRIAAMLARLRGDT